MIEKISEYKKRKELTKKAKIEIAELLKDVNFDNLLEVKSIVNELFALHPDVLSSFILTLNETKSNMIIECFDYNNASKAQHIYLSAIALAKIGNEMGLKSVLENFILCNAFGNKVNKYLYIGLEKALAVDSEILVRKCINWRERCIVGFRKIWMETVEYSSSNTVIECANLWFKNNDIVPTQDEALMLSQNNIVSEKPLKDKLLELSNCSNGELLKELTKRLESAEQIKLEKSELERSKQSLESEVSRLQQTVQIEHQNFEKMFALKNSLENDLINYKKQIGDLRNQLISTKEELEKYKSKLGNIESAFGQAGQTEIDAILGKIKSRLLSEHEKFLELKTKEPDMEYYDILVAMLDEIYRVLKKNGITF